MGLVALLPALGASNPTGQPGQWASVVGEDNRAPVPAHGATTCGQPLNVGYRVMTLGGVKAAVWYPTTASETRFQYAAYAATALATNAPPAPCGKFPLIMFSHGLTGCALQSLFFTEALARRGYVVVAPDHADAMWCHVDMPVDTAKPRGGRKKARLGGEGGAFPSGSNLLKPQTWTDQSYVNRGRDLKNALDALLADPEFAPVIDANRIGVAGHSLGGYTAAGVVGGWESWKDPRYKAALLLSPYVVPFIIQDTLKNIRVPVMYQGGTLDLGITPFVKNHGGAYEKSNAPKYFLDLARAGHFAWTDASCRKLTVPQCLASRPRVKIINDYAFAFLDHYVKGDPASPLLHKRVLGVNDYRYQEE